ncbi:uncharacterized protein LOC114041572 [Vombatus ursinus]|uniref:uncharacterized protein LOC114041572 n=1 Tax=Vombatus ursinus TaxID=29139 RepID=UPI000FFD152E|nr:uncharacterized protein LOC114041572 [Vombatus ursinus]
MCSLCPGRETTELWSKGEPDRLPHPSGPPITRDLTNATATTVGAPWNGGWLSESKVEKPRQPLVFWPRAPRAKGTRMAGNENVRTPREGWPGKGILVWVSRAGSWTAAGRARAELASSRLGEVAAGEGWGTNLGGVARSLKPAYDCSERKLSLVGAVGGQEAGSWPHALPRTQALAGPWMMCFWNPVLLCLGLCLGYMTGARQGKLRKPLLWATPSPTIPAGSPVSIRCRGPPGARLYYLEKAGRPESLLKTHQPWPRNEVSFFISGVSQLNAGPYRCSYQLLAQWSEPSDALELVVTGVSRSKPHLLMKLSTSASVEARAEAHPTAAPGPTEDRGTSGPETMTAPTLQDYTVPNLLRMGLAGFVLAILGVLLAWPGWRDIGAPSGRLCPRRHFHFLSLEGLRGHVLPGPRS